MTIYSHPCPRDLDRKTVLFILWVKTLEHGRDKLLVGMLRQYGIE